MKKRNKVTMERSRIARELERAERQNLQCYVWLHIVDHMDHMGVLDELFEDIMRAVKRISFQTVEIPEEKLNIRSEWHGCIMPEEAAIVKGELTDILSLTTPTYVDDSDSQIWHFAGCTCLVDDPELCFCEYDASKQQGGMIIFFDGKDIPRLLAKHPQLKSKIKIAKDGQYDWLEHIW